MEWIKKYWSQVTTIAIVIVSLTTLSAKVERHDDEIKDIKDRQIVSEAVLNDIKTELSAINAKLGLLLDGKLVIYEKTE